MASSGVTPIPPASKIECRAPDASAKWFFGALISSVAPTASACMAAEPPRDCASRSTPMR